MEEGGGGGAPLYGKLTEALSRIPHCSDGWPKLPLPPNMAPQTAFHTQWSRLARVAAHLQQASAALCLRAEGGRPLWPILTTGYGKPSEGAILGGRGSLGHPSLPTEHLRKLLAGGVAVQHNSSPAGSCLADVTEAHHKNAQGLQRRAKLHLCCEVKAHHASGTLQRHGGTAGAALLQDVTRRAATTWRCDGPVALALMRSGMHM